MLTKALIRPQDHPFLPQPYTHKASKTTKSPIPPTALLEKAPKTTESLILPTTFYSQKHPSPQNQPFLL
jgi:hypothetical protein